MAEEVKPPVEEEVASDAAQEDAPSGFPEPTEETTPEGVEVAEAPEPEEHVTVHLDRDPNDPRNAVPTPKLPSLNDPGQS